MYRIATNIGKTNIWLYSENLQLVKFNLAKIHKGTGTKDIGYTKMLNLASTPSFYTGLLSNRYSPSLLLTLG